MSDEIKDKDGLEEEISADSKENEQNDDTSTQHSDYKPVNRLRTSTVKYKEKPSDLCALHSGMPV